MPGIVRVCLDMEQRVGRVHRFGSKETIIVDTVVVDDSREADAFRIARDKLKLGEFVSGREALTERTRCIPMRELA